MAKTKQVCYTMNPDKGTEFAGWGVYCPLDGYCTEPYQTRKAAENRFRIIKKCGVCRGMDQHLIVPVYVARGGGKRRELSEEEKAVKRAELLPPMENEEAAAFRAAVADGLLDMDVLVVKGA